MTLEGYRGFTFTYCGCFSAFSGQALPAVELGRRVNFSLNVSQTVCLKVHLLLKQQCIWLLVVLEEPLVSLLVSLLTRECIKALQLCVKLFGALHLAERACIGGSAISAALQ